MLLSSKAPNTHIQLFSFIIYICSQFGGYYWNIEDWVDKALELADALDKDGLTYEKGYFFVNGYDSPWTLFNRHNEVWFPKVWIIFRNEILICQRNR